MKVMRAGSDTGTYNHWYTPVSQEYGGETEMILHYEVRYRTSAIRIPGGAVVPAGEWVKLPNKVEGTSVEITGLDSGTAYDVQVRSVSDVGPEPWSEISTGITRLEETEVG